LKMQAVPLLDMHSTSSTEILLPHRLVRRPARYPRKN
jgi:hypothetical protein